jgi:predicted DCC family thiol-disulfide oxidoreductase YuxK
MNAAPLLAARGNPFERFLRHCARYWVIAPRHYPRGVFKYRTIEEAQAARSRRSASQAESIGSVAESLPAALAAGRGRHLVLYDGVCGFCNRMNQFVLAHDARAVFDFASLQSRSAHRILQRFDKNAADLDTFYVVENYQSTAPTLLSKSTASLFVLRAIGGPWRLLTVLGVLPSVLLNAGYDFVARRRYRLFGRSEVCMLPPPEHRQRFIDL